jgi:hypothetical protein
MYILILPDEYSWGGDPSAPSENALNFPLNIGNYYVSELRWIILEKNENHRFTGNNDVAF